MERGEGAESGSLEQVVEGLRSLSGEVESCAVLSPGGELLYSSHLEGVERERVGAVLRALSEAVRDAARRNGKERAERVRIRTELGCLLIVSLENGGALFATTSPQARTGLVLYDMRSIRGELVKAMRGGRG
ncbi:roadblock/LC7 domain-containing protein [Rubrobacter calidifluminis]|uniref:roadblock/LC7 domain-containing protein n=1 Tax=Rubrobacter calidifluminis TaxID=1392640 RepID=UPI00235E13C9|nr:roadblock/LC7 domain-containing protein [Rubrobacter calidifluminis]